MAISIGKRYFDQSHILETHTNELFTSRIVNSGTCSVVEHYLVCTRLWVLFPAWRWKKVGIRLAGRWNSNSLSFQFVPLHCCVALSGMYFSLLILWYVNIILIKMRKVVLGLNTGPCEQIYTTQMGPRDYLACLHWWVNQLGIFWVICCVGDAPPLHCHMLYHRCSSLRERREGPT